MPTQLAHEAVNLALNYTEKTVEWGKSKPGFLKSVIERVEGPVVKTLETRAIKTVVKIGDSVLTTVDGTLDKAISSTYYKSGEAYVKSAYSNRIVPATNTVTTTVASTTSRVTTPVVNVYSGVLAFADKQVGRISSAPSIFTVKVPERSCPKGSECIFTRGNAFQTLDCNPLLESLKPVLLRSTCRAASGKPRL